MATDVPFDLNRIVETCLRKDPGGRFQSMREVQAALASLKRQSESGALYDSPTARTIMPAPVKPHASKAPAVVLASVLLAAVAVGGGYWWTWHGALPPPTAASPLSEGTLNNDSIVDMTAARVAPAVILSQIRASKTNFNLSAAEVIRLSKAGVPAAVIEAMRNPHPAASEAPKAAGAGNHNSRPRRCSAHPPDSVGRYPERCRGRRCRAVPGRARCARGGNRDHPQRRTTEAIGVIVDGAKKRISRHRGQNHFRLESVDAVDGQKVTIRATPARRRGGISKRPVNAGSVPGAEYLGYIDGANTVMVKK